MSLRDQNTRLHILRTWIILGRSILLQRAYRNRLLRLYSNIWKRRRRSLEVQLECMLTTNTHPHILAWLTSLRISACQNKTKGLHASYIVSIRSASLRKVWLIWTQRLQHHFHAQQSSHAWYRLQLWQRGFALWQGRWAQIQERYLDSQQVIRNRLVKHKILKIWHKRTRKKRIITWFKRRKAREIHHWFKGASVAACP